MSVVKGCTTTIGVVIGLFIALTVIPTLFYMGLFSLAFWDMDNQKERMKDQQEAERREVGPREPDPLRPLPVVDNQPAVQPDPQEDDGPTIGEQIETRAAARLNAAKALLRQGKKNEGRRWLERIVGETPNTDAAREAGELLKRK